MQAIDQSIDMQGPANPSDPKATVVQTTDDASLFPQVPGYRVLRKLGQGGMATVYLATQESLDRPVSIKVMASGTLTDETSKSRFENEARTIARLSHPSIVSIHEVGRTADGRMYYIMPFLPNGDLAQRDLSNEEPRIIELLRALLSALDYAHARGIVHRDVKLENVLFDSANRPLLADFGIALSKSDNVRITTAGLAVGSSGCMAPEQARGDAVDGRADLYSVGVLAFELLTGELPFRSSDAVALALMHAQKPIPRLPQAKRHWQGFIDRAMAKSPDDRFQNAQQMLSALDRIDLRGGDRLSGRVKRRFDQALDGKGWKRPLVLALGSVAVLAAGLYAVRDRLPQFGSTAGSDQPPATSAKQHDVSLVSSPAANTTAESAPINLLVPVPPATPDTSPGAAAATTTSSAVDTAIRDARAQLDQGNLVEPPGKNAWELSRVAWQLAPASADTSKLVADVLHAVSLQQVQAISRHHDQRVLIYQSNASLLDETTIGPSAPAWRAFEAATTDALRSRAHKEATNSAALTTTVALAKTIGMPLDLAQPQAPAPTTMPAATQLAASANQPSLSAGASSQVQVADTSAGANMSVDEAGFVFLHGPIKNFAGAAIGRSEVTRQQYGEFVNATHRAPSSCARADRSGEAAAQRSWSNPGFAQNSDHPVVCISWDDALAYTQWLSERNAHRYRLPSRAEWRLATLAGTSTTVTGNGTAAAASGTPNPLGLTGLDGNVGQWLFDCADACQKHLVAGRSWRNRGGEGPAPREGDRGFDDVGFRVVRVLGGRNAGNADSIEPSASPTRPAAAAADQRPNLPKFFGRRHRKN